MKARRSTTNFTLSVYRVVRCIPRGKVVSYGGVAAMLGKPRAARAVGHALSALPDGSDVPWWRVMNHTGGISIRGVDHAAVLQRALLEREGVRFDRAGRTDWAVFGWDGSGRPRALRSASQQTGAAEPEREGPFSVRRQPKRKAHAADTRR
ncbi:MAG: MGMT family protein [Longimicrobiales bacterium]